jgi:hypothetical protein
MTEETLLSSWRAAMIAATAGCLSAEDKDRLIQELQQRAAAVQEHLSQLEQMVAQAAPWSKPNGSSMACLKL